MTIYHIKVDKNTLSRVLNIQEIMKLCQQFCTRMNSCINNVFAAYLFEERLNLYQQFGQLTWLIFKLNKLVNEPNKCTDTSLSLMHIIVEIKVHLISDFVVSYFLGSSLQQKDDIPATAITRMIKLVVNCVLEILSTQNSECDKCCKFVYKMQSIKQSLHNVIRKMEEISNADLSLSTLESVFVKVNIERNKDDQLITFHKERQKKDEFT